MIGKWLLQGFQIGVTAFGAVFAFSVLALAILALAALVGKFIGHGEDTHV